MKKELFIESIQNLKKHQENKGEFLIKFANLFGADLKNFEYYYHHLENQFIKILQEEMQDTFPSQIEEFCFEQNFGEIKGKYKDAGELWEYLSKF